MEKRAETLRRLKIELARRNLYEYEKILNPGFFLDSRWHLKRIADTLQDLYRGKLTNEDGEPIKKLMINCPPRHGKSYSVINFSQWILGSNKKNKIITVSYNETLSTRFSKGVRNTIDATRLDDSIIFNDIFPGVKIKHGDSAAQLWSLRGEHFSYLGTSPKGSMTGMGCNIGIIDDLVKNKEEAYNQRVLDEHWDFYLNTFLSRLEEGAIQILIMTRWNKNDLCGRLLATEPDDWYVLQFEAYNGEQMLCEDLLSEKTYRDLISKLPNEITRAVYHQTPIDIEGVLYKELKTYTEVPSAGGTPLFNQIRNYTDTADEGDDYLCSINYGEYSKEAYILDVLYTKEGMETTEPATARLLYDGRVNRAKIESNNGGRGFARNVDRILGQDFDTNITDVAWFHQSKNKMARILSNSAWVQKHIYFPVNWKDRWPLFYHHVTTFLKEGKNQPDDAQDCLTGIAENIQGSQHAILI